MDISSKSSLIHSSCSVCGTTVMFDLNRQTSISTQSADTQLTHADNIDFKQVEFNCHKPNECKGDSDMPSITSEEEEAPCPKVPVKTVYTADPTKVFSTNLANNRWLKGRRRSKRQSFMPSIKQIPPRVSKENKDAFSLRTSKTTVNLVEIVKKFKLKHVNHHLF